MWWFILVLKGRSLRLAINGSSIIHYATDERDGVQSSLPILYTNDVLMVV